MQWRPLRYVKNSPGAIAFFCALFYIAPSDIFCAFVAAALLHEAGHLLVLRARRIPVLSLRISLSGASIVTPPLGYCDELLAASAGPVINFVLFFAFLKRIPYFALVNLGLLLFNLLPFYPLDGGRILRALLRLLLGERIGRWIERIVHVLCLLLLGAAAIYLTCILHAGLWPVLTFAFLLLRVADAAAPGD